MNKRSYSIYLDSDLFDYIKDTFKAVSVSQFINDVLNKEINFIKAIDDLYKREVNKDEYNKRNRTD